MGLALQQIQRGHRELDQQRQVLLVEGQHMGHPRGPAGLQGGGGVVLIIQQGSRNQRGWQTQGLGMGRQVIRGKRSGKTGARGRGRGQGEGRQGHRPPTRPRDAGRGFRRRGRLPRISHGADEAAAQVILQCPVHWALAARGLARGEGRGPNDRQGARLTPAVRLASRACAPPVPKPYVRGGPHPQSRFLVLGPSCSTTLRIPVG